VYNKSSRYGCTLDRQAQNVPALLAGILEEMAFDPGHEHPDESDPVDADQLAAAALMLFPGRGTQSARARRQLRPVSYEADAVDAVWTPEVHWRWQSPAFHAAVRALLLSHLRLRNTPVEMGAGVHLGCLPHDVMLPIVSQLGEVWVEALPLVVRNCYFKERALPDIFDEDPPSS
jgi:hypothetical protein